MNFKGTDGTFTSAKDTAAAAGITDLASIGISRGDGSFFGSEYCHFECPYQEQVLRKFQNNYQSFIFVNICINL